MFLLFVLGPNATTWDSVAMIGDKVFTVTLENAKADGRYYGAAYTAGAHNGVFNYATRTVKPDAPPPMIAVAREAYSHRFGTHDMTVAFKDGRYGVSFDGAAPILTGSYELGPGSVIWKPAEPAWTRGVVLKSEIRPRAAGGYDLTVARTP